MKTLLVAVWLSRVAASYVIYAAMELVSVFGVFDNRLSEAVAIGALDMWPGDLDLFLQP